MHARIDLSSRALRALRRFSSSTARLPELGVFRSSWGVEDEVVVVDRGKGSFATWPEVFKYLTQKGYDGIECSLGDMAKAGPNGPARQNGIERFAASLSEFKLKLICGVYTSWQDYEGPNEALGVGEHLARYCNQLQTVSSMLNPCHVNVHSGADWWSLADKQRFVAEAIAIEKDFGIACSHETHRGRMLFNPFVTAELLEKFPSLLITADFSHWVVVCERLLQSRFEKDIMLKCAEHTAHIHARVGSPSSAQVRDPLSPEWREALRQHEGWWRAVWEARWRKGDKYFTLTPEYGPPPYLPGPGYCAVSSQFTLPVVPLSRLIDVQARRQRDRFAGWAAAKTAHMIIENDHHGKGKLPIIDVSAFMMGANSNSSPSSTLTATTATSSTSSTSSSLEQRRAVAAQVHAACQDLGFFYVTGHGVPLSHLQALIDGTAEFFAQPLEQKQALAMDSVKGFKTGRGYQVLGENITLSKPDQHEGLDLLRELPTEQILEKMNTKARTPYEILALPRNHWPKGPFRDLLETHIRLMCDVGAAVMRAIALGLGLPEDYFVANHLTDDPFWLLRAIHYPPLPEGGQEMSCGEHCDYGCLTFIASDETRGALQVRARNGEWIDANPIEGAFVVNIGDVLAEWSGGLYVSTPHRVVNNSPAPRVSVPFFFEPNFDASLGPLPQGSQTKVTGEGKCYGDHLFSKISKNFTPGENKQTELHFS